MKWILISIVVAVIWFYIRFLRDLKLQRNAIASQGGIGAIYKTLIDGLLQYSSARIVQDKKDFITIGGTFTDSITNRECGVWSIVIQPTFKILSVRYRAHIDLGGGKSAKQTWDFPIEMSQNEMLGIIKKKADEWDIYCVYK